MAVYLIIFNILIKIYYIFFVWEGWQLGSLKVFKWINLDGFKEQVDENNENLSYF